MEEQDIKRHWYALKVFYNKVFEIEKALQKERFEVYFPVRKEQVRAEALRRVDTSTKYERVGDKVVFRRIPVVNSLLFVKAGEDDIAKIQQLVYGHALVYYNAERTAPAVIPDREMAIFRMVAESGADGLQFFSDESIVNFRQGNKVRVTAGPLKGAEGYIKRIKRDRRLLVAIEGFVAVATSYIPPEMLETIG